MIRYMNTFSQKAVEKKTIDWDQYFVVAKDLQRLYKENEKIRREVYAQYRSGKYTEEFVEA